MGWGLGMLLVPVRAKFQDGIVRNICVLLFGFFTARHAFVFTMDKLKSKQLFGIFGSDPTCNCHQGMLHCYKCVS